jgi:prepilin-type N-terminal cleavage/methylation domain-containing protein
MRHRTAHRRRRGFTLVELLVVIAILLILIGLAAGLSPKAIGGRKMLQAANTLSGALMMAKQRAKRDRLPTGIRLVQPTTVGANPLWIQDLILIQQPDDLTGGTPGDPRAAMLNCPASSVPDQDRNALGLRKLGQVVNFTNVNFTPNGGGPRALVQQGDWLEVNGGGLPHRILNASASTLMLQLASDASCYVGSDPTTNFRIIRGPRALIGEVPIHLKHDIAIDLTPYSVGNPTSQNYRVDLFTNPPNIDILFSPGGAVLATGNSVPSPAAPGDSNVYLYLRDTTETNHFYGEPLVVTVFSRSGFVKTSPVAFPPAPDPLTFAKDARGSGQ